jgi:hypothetical protein
MLHPFLNQCLLLQVIFTNIEYSEIFIELETQQVIESICKKSLPVMRLGKQFLHRQLKMDIMEAYKYINEVHV